MEAAIGGKWNRVLAGAVLSAIAVFVVLYFPDRDDLSGAVAGGILVLVPAALGIAVIGQVRPLPRRTGQGYLIAAGSALAWGVTLGAANLVANRSLAMLDPVIHQQMVERWSEYSRWSIVIADPLIEEFVFRLFLMGGVAWLVSRVSSNRRRVFWIALGVSALLFGLIHIVARPPMPIAGATNIAYSVGVVLKSAAAGGLLGWVFWRWGLPHSFACHSVANATHLLLAPALF